MIKVMTSGTFDILHYGHIRLLRRARELGDYLIAVCSNDECASSKGKNCYYSFDVRKELLGSIRFVDEVIEENCLFDDALSNLCNIAIEKSVDIFVLGSDYQDTLPTMRDYDRLNKLVKIVFLERTDGISTSKIKEDLEKAQYYQTTVGGSQMAVQEWLRQVQLIELEALDEMMRICDKHGLTYYIDGGSLLGAVRHKGFIPWDDDIDLAMPRADYDKFVKIAYDELDPKFHFESMEYDSNDFYVMVSRIRRKNTIYMTKRSAKHDLQCHGIWIDIFPFDDQPGSDTLAMAIDWKLYNLLVNILVRYHYDNEQRTMLGKIQAFFAQMISFDQYRKLAKRLMTRHNGKDLPFWKTPVLGTHYKRTTLRKSWSEPRITLEFEGRQVPAPSNYDAILTQYYGDYMTPPPEEKRKLHTPVRVSFDTNGPDIQL